MANEKRLIDANALKEQIANEIHTYWTNGTGGYCLAEDVIPDIDNAPNVDAVEVVRCKDCKHWNPSGSMAGNSEDDLQPIGGCEWANCCRKANDFCSYGERRSE